MDHHVISTDELPADAARKEIHYHDPEVSKEILIQYMVAVVMTNPQNDHSD